MVQRQVEVIEKGDIFFFYRPRVEAEEVRGREDVQRLFMTLAPDEPHKHYRLFVLGRKKLPRAKGGRDGERRNWALNVRTTDSPEDIRRELLGKEYTTETRGERHAGAARPVGEGKYELFRHGDHTELAYVLELPEKPGPAQQELAIERQASFVVAVKNPEVSIPGFPAPKEPPAYGPELEANFGHRRWIDAGDPALIDKEHAQLLLIAAESGAAVDELGLALEKEEEKRTTAEVCKQLALWCEGEAVKPLFTGEFPAREEQAPGEEVERLPPEKAPGRGGKKGGKAAASRGASAAAITKLLRGIEFPTSRKALVAHAREHESRLEEPEEAIAVLRKLPAGRFATMADVMKALGEIR